MRFGRERRHKRWKLEETDNMEAAATEEQAPETSETPETPEAAESAETPENAESTEAAETQESSEAPAGESAPSEPPKPAEPDWKDRYARLMADFDNFKKRTARDREDTYRYAEMDILKDVLPAVDNLSLALANAMANKDDPFVKGVQLVYDTLLKSLKEHGAEPFDSVGKDLDTEKMEAIATLPSPDVPEGKVSIESKKGWMLKDKVLRVAQVVVSSGKPGGEK